MNQSPDDPKPSSPSPTPCAPPATPAPSAPPVPPTPPAPPTSPVAAVAATAAVPPLLRAGGLSRELSRVLLLGFGLVCLWQLSHALVDILLMFAMVFLVAVILNSVVVWLEKRGVRRSLAVAAIMLAFLGGAMFAGWKIVPPALQQANNLVKSAPGYWKKIQERASVLEERYPALHNVLPQIGQGSSDGNSAKSADESGGKATSANSSSAEASLPPEIGSAPAKATGKENGSKVSGGKDGDSESKGTPQITDLIQQDALFGYAKHALAFTTSLAGGIFVFVLSLLLLMFCLSRPQDLVGGVLSVVPDNQREPTRRSLARIFVQMTGWARATIINGTMTGVLTGLGLYFVGVPSALILGICAFFGEFVPSLGPLVASLPAIFVALSISPAKALAALGVIVVIQAVVSNALNPIIMGREMKLHPASIMFSALAMGKLFGVAGAILAVPTAATLKILVEEFYLFPRGVDLKEIEKQSEEIVSLQANIEEPDTA